MLDVSRSRVEHVPDVLKLEVPAHAKATRYLHMGIRQTWTARYPCFAIAADVVRDGKYLGT